MPDFILSVESGGAQWQGEWVLLALRDILIAGLDALSPHDPTLFDALAVVRLTLVDPSQDQWWSVDIKPVSGWQDVLSELVGATQDKSATKTRADKNGR